MTHDDLGRLYNEAVVKHGRNAAITALVGVTGRPFVKQTPDGMIEATATALRDIARPRVHERLSDLARAIYAKR